MLMTGAMVRAMVNEVRRSRQTATEVQAQWLAESAALRAAAQLRRDPDYQGETWKTAIMDAQREQATAFAEIRVEKLPDAPQRVQVTIDSRYPDHPWRRVAVQRSYELSTAIKQSPPGDAREESMP